MKDKEKQINVSTEEEIEARNKIGKEKDELRQVLLHYATAEASGGIKSLIDCEGCAFYLYENLGYQKLPEDSVVISKERFDALETIEKHHIKSCGKDSVVLSMEEYEKLNELKGFFETCGTISTKELYDYMQEFKEGTSKETAEKSLNDIFKICKQRFNDTKGYTCWGDIEIAIHQYAEQVGVEIKE